MWSKPVSVVWAEAGNSATNPIPISMSELLFTDIPSANPTPLQRARRALASAEAQEQPTDPQDAIDHQRVIANLAQIVRNEEQKQLLN